MIQSIQQAGRLISFASCLVILLTIFSGGFPCYGYTRIMYLVLSAIGTIILTVSFIINLAKNTLYRKVFLLILFFGTALLSIYYYRYLILKQDLLIANAIFTMERNVENYELLSNFPESEAIAILKNGRIPKVLCGVSYFFKAFYLCVNSEGRTIDFMVDITAGYNGKKTIRASKSIDR